MLLSQTRNCECGSFEEGVGCCSGTASGNGIFVVYTPGEGSTWEVSEVTEIEGTVAQSKCCEN